MISEDDFIKKSKQLYRLFVGEKEGVLSTIFGPHAEERAKEPETVNNVTITLSPEDMLAVLICLGAADGDAVSKTKYPGAKVKPAPVLDIYSSFRRMAREAGIIK